MTLKDPPPIGAYTSESVNAEDEMRKRRILLMSLYILVPAIFAFMVWEYFFKDSYEWLIDLALVILLTINLVAIKMDKSFIPFLRATLGFILVIFAIGLVTGAGDGMSFVWYYVMPIGLFFMFGHREGLLWVAATGIVGAVCLFLPFGYEYNNAISARFLVNYTVIAGVAYGLEEARYYFAKRLFEEKKELEDRLNQIRTLHGLLPICAHCKKIRDDSGYWNQLETYISDHSDAVFSHGLCPTCMEKLYPEYSGRLEDIDIIHAHQDSEDRSI